MENISVTIRAKSGSIFLAPMPIHLSPTLAGEITVAKGGQTGRDLTILGNVQAVNSALEWIQYLGDEHFYGNDAISLSAVNKNGARDAHVAVRVNPVNDPPFIRGPKFVILEKEPTEGIPIFDGRASSPLELFIGDPDLHSFPENRSRFVVTLSLELSDGVLIGSLPAHLIGTVELKVKNSHQWQHLQAFVTISNYFIIKGRGIRFRANVDDCNDAIRRLLYQGTGRGSVLTINVNDMGSYGCCSECGERMSAPLQAEATVNLIRRRPVNSISAHLLGVAVVIELLSRCYFSAARFYFTSASAPIFCTGIEHHFLQQLPHWETPPRPGGAAGSHQRPRSILSSSDGPRFIADLTSGEDRVTWTAPGRDPHRRLATSGPFITTSPLFPLISPGAIPKPTRHHYSLSLYLRL